MLGELNQRVRLACRNHEDNMLAFSMSFVNHHGKQATHTTRTHTDAHMA